MTNPAQNWVNVISLPIPAVLSPSSFICTNKYLDVMIVKNENMITRRILVLRQFWLPVYEDLVGMFWK